MEPAAHSHLRFRFSAKYIKLDQKNIRRLVRPFKMQKARKFLIYGIDRARRKILSPYVQKLVINIVAQNNITSSGHPNSPRRAIHLRNKCGGPPRGFQVRRLAPQVRLLPTLQGGRAFSTKGAAAGNI